MLILTQAIVRSKVPAQLLTDDTLCKNIHASLAFLHLQALAMPESASDYFHYRAHYIDVLRRRREYIAQAAAQAVEKERVTRFLKVHSPKHYIIIVKH